MKRSDFFKSVFGAIAIVTIPNQSQAIEEKEKEYSFDEVFEVHDKNKRLIYPKKDCEVYKKIKELVGHERILEGKYFTCYHGYDYNLIPVKGVYSISDFVPFILATQSYYKKDHCFSEAQKGVFFRMFKETPGTMHFDTFEGDVKGQYHS